MLLKNGSKGDDVKKLQEKLGLTADGAFGPGTEAKVKAWQAANGLTADGLVGAGTWAKMFGSAPAAAPGRLNVLEVFILLTSILLLLGSMFIETCL